MSSFVIQTQHPTFYIRHKHSATPVTPRSCVLHYVYYDLIIVSIVIVTIVTINIDKNVILLVFGGAAFAAEFTSAYLYVANDPPDGAGKTGSFGQENPSFN